MADKSTNTQEKTKKEISKSIISLSRSSKLGIDLANPLNLDQLYASIPEISRATDFRAGMIAPNGYEVISAADDDTSKQFAALCYQIIETSGGVGFFEQYHKNTDLYGDGYVELVSNQLSEIVELSHVHPYHFGYETETVNDPENPSERIQIVKVDKNSQKPVGFAQFKVNPATGDLEVDKKIPLEKIAHLKFKVVGDSFYGISLIQPMIGSVTRKVRLEDYADKAARLIAVPKLVLKGTYDNDEEKKIDAREAANLDVNDVIVLEGEDTDVQFVNPGSTNIPELREMFITNITTASGVPRPALTSESAEINKATMDILMQNTRAILKSHQLLVSNLFEHVIFPRIAISYKIQNYTSIIPKLYFPEDNDTANNRIDTVKRKAVALTSLANTYALLLKASKTDDNTTSGIKNIPNNIKKDSENGIAAKEMSADKKKNVDKNAEIGSKLPLILSEMEDLLLSTIKQFKFTNDTTPVNIEPYKKQTSKDKKTTRSVENTAYIPKTQTGIELSFLDKFYTDFSLSQPINNKSEDAFNKAYDAYKSGHTVIDRNTEKILTINDFNMFKKELDLSNND